MDKGEKWHTQTLIVSYKHLKTSGGFNGIWSRGLCDAGAML